MTMTIEDGINPTTWAEARRLMYEGTKWDVVRALTRMVEADAVFFSDCPHCGAQPYQQCFWLPGQIAQITHFERIVKAWS